MKVQNGNKYGRFTVIEALHEKQNRYWLALCRCDCGTEKVVAHASLNHGRSKSCGCLSKELPTFHGMRDTPTYQSWAHMIQRCFNPNSTSWDDYGGRGITTCERWKSFQNFYADMGIRPDGQSIDRKDTNGNYEPSNCRWATDLEQHQNIRNNVNLTLNGVTACAREWSRRLGIKYPTILARAGKGWPDEKVLTPVS